MYFCFYVFVSFCDIVCFLCLSQILCIFGCVSCVFLYIFLAFLVCFGVFLMCVFIFLRVFFVSWLVNRFPPTPGRKMSLGPEHRPRHLLVQIQIKEHFQEFFLSLSFTTHGGAFVTFIHFSENNVCILMTAGYL